MTELEKLEGLYHQEIEEKWRPAFERQSSYLGNGIYGIAGLVSQDTRELFLMFIHQQETVEQQRQEGWSYSIVGRVRKREHYYRDGKSLCGRAVVTQHMNHFSQEIGGTHEGKCLMCVKRQLKELKIPKGVF